MNDPTPDDQPRYPSYPGDGPAPSPPPAGPLSYGGIPEKVDGLAIAVLAVAAVYTLANVVEAGLAFAAKSSYSDALDRGQSTVDMITPYDVFGIAWLPVSLAAYVVTSLWMFRMRTNVDQLRPDMQHARKRGWAWGCWICPVVSLWFPYQYVRDLLRRHRDDSGPSVLGWWWGLFLASLAIEQILSRISYYDESGEVSLDSFGTIAGMQVVSAVITLVAFILWFRVVTRLRADQRELVGAHA